jgi:putative thioredoxin
MQNIVEINLENAQAQLIDESFKRPVLVDFWADWCAPCKSLMPVLEKLANEYQGQFLLAKVNADEQNMIAAQFGVRNLPTVILIKDGQPLDGFVGAKSEIEVRDILAKYLPKPWEKDLLQAQQSMQAGDFNGALSLLRQVHEASAQAPFVSCLLAQVLVELNRIEEAEALLKTVKMADQDALYQQVLAQLQLRQQAAKTPELAALEEAHAREPENLDIAYQLALQLYQEHYHRPALELLYKVLQANRQFADGAARKTYTDILASLGKGDPLAIEFQRKLFTLLY